jgi:hypothetical protein
MVHLSPETVVGAANYSKWMRRFAQSSHHLLLGEGNCAPFTAFQASTSYTAKLNKLFPVAFSSLTLCGSHSSSNLDHHSGSCVSAYPGLTYALLPLRSRGLEPFSINQTPVSGDILLASQSWVHEEVSQFWQEIRGDDLNSQLTTAVSEALAFRSQTLEAPESLPEIFCEDNSIAFLGLAISVTSLSLTSVPLMTRDRMCTAFKVSQRVRNLSPGLTSCADKSLITHLHPSSLL